MQTIVVCNFCSILSYVGIDKYIVLFIRLLHIFLGCPKFFVLKINELFDRKIAETFGSFKKKYYLCTRNSEILLIIPGYATGRSAARQRSWFGTRRPQVRILSPRQSSIFRVSRCFIAAIAQLVEHDLAKVGVASSSLVCRSLIFWKAFQLSQN